MRISVELTVNGERRRVEVRPQERLLDLLRNEFGLRSVKEVCAEGDCGACTVIVDDQALDSCLLLAALADGREVITVEGLAQGGRLHPIQEEFVNRGAIQCGFCMPGMMLAAKAFLDDNPRPTEAEVRLALSGNVCRCTGYTKAVEATLAAAARLA